MSRRTINRSVTLSVERLEERTVMAAEVFRAPSLNFSEAAFRTITGHGNNLDPNKTSQGAAETRVIRFGYEAEFPDGHGDAIFTPPERANPRDISNAISAQSSSIPNNRHLTDWVVQWGQFLTHDLALTRTGAQFNGSGTYFIPVYGANDPLRSPSGIPFNRSEFDPTTGDATLVPGFPEGTFRPNWREQINAITSYIDASNVYGSDVERAKELRAANGKLVTTARGLLPGLNPDPVKFVNDDPKHLGTQLFLAGDIRANEQVGLTATHALFVREHNRLATLLKAQNPRWNSDQIYEVARAIVAAEMQIITYNEFLPALLGFENAPRAKEYAYSSAVNASITNSFAAAIFRFAHSMVSSDLLLVNNNNKVTGKISIADAFFNPAFLANKPGNVDLLLKGLATQLAQENDTKLVDGVRNSLFGPPGSGGLDLAALDIQRGRDHGLPDYKTLLARYSVPKTVTSFADITSDTALQAALASLYGNVDNIDPFVGALAEDHLPGSSVGPLTNAIIANQFERLRDGDRFFYSNDPVLASRQVKSIIDLNNLTLSKIIQLNTGVKNLQSNVFFDPSVLYFKMPDVGGSLQLSIVNGQLRLKDGAGRTLESRALKDVSQVMLIGSDTKADAYTIDIASLNSLQGKSLIVYGGKDAANVLKVLGTPKVDTFVVDTQTVGINGNSISHSGFSSLVLQPGRGRDVVQVLDDTVPFTVQDPDGYVRQPAPVTLASSTVTKSQTAPASAAASLPSSSQGVSGASLAATDLLFGTPSSLDDLLIPIG